MNSGKNSSRGVWSKKYGISCMHKQCVPGLSSGRRGLGTRLNLSVLLVSFWFSCVIKCVCNMYTQNHSPWPSSRLLLLAVWGLFPVNTADKSCFDASRLNINTRPLFSCSTHSAKLLFFQKATVVVVIVNITGNITRNRMDGGYRHKSNIIFNKCSLSIFDSN